MPWQGPTPASSCGGGKLPSSFLSCQLAAPFRADKPLAAVVISWLRPLPSLFPFSHGFLGDAEL